MKTRNIFLYNYQVDCYYFFFFELILSIWESLIIIIRKLYLSKNEDLPDLFLFLSNLEVFIWFVLKIYLIPSIYHVFFSIFRWHFNTLLTYYIIFDYIANTNPFQSLFLIHNIPSFLFIFFIVILNILVHIFNIR